MNTQIKYHATFLAIFFVFGCVPYPHLYQRLPNVSGTLTDNGLPVEGAQVMLGELSRNGLCDPMRGPVISANDGTFSIEGAKRLRLYVLAVPVEHFEKWAVCIKAKDHEPLAYIRGKMGPGPISSPKSVKLLCDLSKKNICEVTAEEHGKW